MPFKAYNDNLLVKEIKQSNTSGGIIIPNSSKEFISGKVVSSADESIKEGDVVMYNKESARDINVEGQGLKILKIKDVVLSTNE